MTRAEAEEAWGQIVAYVTRKSGQIYKPQDFRRRIFVFEQVSGEPAPLSSSMPTSEQWLRFWVAKLKQYRKIDQELEVLLIEYIQELRHGSR